MGTKIIRGSSLNKALSIHTTNTPSQSRETVPLSPDSRFIMHHHQKPAFQICRSRPTQDHNSYIDLLTGGNFKKILVPYCRP
jgi:hypothetical protein